MRFSALILGSIPALALFAATNAQASYLYDWDLSGGASTVTLTSDHGDYQMKLVNEPTRGPLGDGTDTTATVMTIVPIHKGTVDTFHSAFDLSLVITDQANGLKNDGVGSDPKPLVYHVTFTTMVFSHGATQTSAVSLAPTTDTIVLGKDTFTVGIPQTGQWFVAPPSVGSTNTGSVGLSIDFKQGSGGGGNPSPEPSSMVLASLGMAFSGLSAWRKKKRNAAVALA